MSVKNLKYTLKEVTANVFLVTFKTAYDVAMTFCRVQEFYESPVFKNKLFRMEDYTRHYAFDNNSVFTYPKDWRGFNVPSRVIEKVLLNLFVNHYDTITDYDEVMIKIVNQIKEKVKDGSYYLIGTSREKGDSSVVQHEIAHGLYSTNEVYHQKVKQLVKKLSLRAKSKVYQALKDLKYHKSVWNDELNAYMSTGLHHSMNNVHVRNSRKPFMALLQETK